MPIKFATSIIIALALQLMVGASTFASPGSSQDIWYSLYFQSSHSGYSHIVSEPGTWKGHPALEQDSTTITKLNVFGTVVEQDIVSQSWSDTVTGQPFFQSFNIESGGSTTHVQATFSPTAIYAVLTSGTETSDKTIPIPAGEKIIDGNSEGMDAKGPLKVGQTETDLEFDPVTLALDKQVCKVIAVNVPVKDPRDGLLHATSKIYISDPEGDATAFQTADATPILVLMPANLVMICTDQSHAMSQDSSQADFAVDPTASSGSPNQVYAPEPDLAVATAVSPTGVKLGDERSLTQLTVAVTVTGHPTKTYDEIAIAVPPPDSDPISALSTPQTAPFLKSAPYLTADDPKIKAVSSEIVGGETNSYAAVKLIHDWVFANMSPIGSLGLPRSATDILHNKQGVCRDYAILYTSLARAAGIPTKINAGLVGFEGRFYYHAWASSYIGGSVGWLPVDPTMTTMFVDASHIALGSGDATVMFSLSDVIGNAKVVTLSLRNSL